MAVVNVPFDLQHFVNAQNPVYERVCAELRAGQKEGHWMWFIFPQLRGWGHSAMANVFGISSRQEAVAYVDHTVLGPRLRECTSLVNLVEGRAIDQIFVYPDDLKFRTSMTLFASVASDNQGVQKYFGGEPDPLTWTGLIDCPISPSFRSGRSAQPSQGHRSDPL
jgi:uncharacterized protein (DUF1810 family)